MASAVFYLVSVLLVAGVAMASTPVKGGLGEVKPVNDDAREAFNAVKTEVAAKYSLDAAKLEPEQYATQTVADTMFFIRIRITNRSHDNYLFAKVLRDIQGHFTLKGTLDADTHEALRFF